MIMPIDPEELKRAFRAFKKRLKLTRLDNDSRLGHSPLSGTGKSEIIAIQPPSGFTREVWEELVTQGQLRNAGYGLYELADKRREES
jgi:hypothetical protein